MVPQRSALTWPARSRASLAILLSLLSAAGLGASALAGITAANAAAAARPAMQVSAAAAATCAVTATRHVQCWGDVVNGQAKVPAGTYRQVSAGSNGYACAITTKGRLACWGGGQYACAVATAGGLKCWGNDPNITGTVPDGRFTAVAAGQQFACGIETGGGLHCWGPSGTPAPPSGKFTAVSAAYGNPVDYACALTSGGQVKCWGTGPDGVTSPPRVHFSSFSVGLINCCGITSGQIRCWGASTQGILVPPSGKYAQVSTGDEYACAVTTTRLIRCWGQPGFDDLGAQPAVPAPAPASSLLQGAAYSYAFPNSRGLPAGTFSVSHGALPAGLKMSGNGVLSGTPAAPGSFTFTVTVANVEGSKHAQFTVRVASTLLGFGSPRAGAGVANSRKPLAVAFRLGSYRGVRLRNSPASKLATKITLSANASGAAPVSAADCACHPARHEFTCQLPRPAHVRTGKAHPYYLSVYERLGARYLLVPLTKALTSGNPKMIYYK